MFTKMFTLALLALATAHKGGPKGGPKGAKDTVPGKDGLKSAEHALGLIQAWIDVLTDVVENGDKTYSKSMRSAFAKDATGYFPGLDGKMMHFKGGDALGDFFENTWMKPNEYVAFHQNTAVHSKWSVLVHGTAAGKTLDGCIFNLDYLVEVSYAPGKIIAWNGVYDPERMAQQCGLPAMNKNPVLVPFPDDAAGVQFVNGFCSSLERALNGNDEHFDDVFAADMNQFFSKDLDLYLQHRNSEPYKDAKVFGSEYLKPNWAVGTAHWELGTPYISMSFGNTVHFMAVASGTQAETGCHMIIPYAGLYVVNEEGKISKFLQIWSDPSPSQITGCKPTKDEL